MFSVDYGSHRLQIAPKTGKWEIWRGGTIVGRGPEDSPHSQEEHERVGKLGHLILQITNQCNYQCRHCFARSDGSPEMMPRETAVRAIWGALCHTPYKVLTVLFEGGEPLLAFPLMRDLVTGFDEAQLPKRIRWQLQTNGSILTDEVIRFLRENDVEVSVGIDEIGDRAPTLRVLPNGARTGPVVLSNIKRMLAEGIGVHALAVMHKGNYRYAKELIGHLYAIGVRHLALNWLMPTGRAMDADMSSASSPSQTVYDVWGCSPQEALETVQQVVSHVLDLNRRNPNDRIRERNIAFLFNAIRTGRREFMCNICPCGAGKETVTVVPDGTVHPCAWFYNRGHGPSFVLGSIHDGDFDAVLAKGRTCLVAERSAERIPQCAVCPWQFYCGCGCPATAFYGRGDLLRPGAVCEVTQAVLSWVFSQVHTPQEMGLLC